MLLRELSQDFPQFVESFTTPLMKVLKKHVQECSSDQSGSKQKKLPVRAQAQMKGDIAKPSGNMCLILKILGNDKIGNAETKKIVLYTMSALLSLKVRNLSYRNRFPSKLFQLLTPDFSFYL